MHCLSSTVAWENSTFSPAPFVVVSHFFWASSPNIFTLKEDMCWLEPYRGIGQGPIQGHRQNKKFLFLQLPLVMFHRMHGQRPVPFCIFHLYKFKIKIYNLYLCLYMMGLCRKVFLQIFTVYVQSKSSTLMNILFVVVSFHICSGSLCKLVVGLSVNVNLHTLEHTLSFTFHNILSHFKYVNWLYSWKST